VITENLLHCKYYQILLCVKKIFVINMNATSKINTAVIFIFKNGIKPPEICLILQEQSMKQRERRRLEDSYHMALILY